MELSVAQRLEALAHLQAIDKRLDRIRQIRGGLPEEVRDLEDELEGIKTRINRLNEEIEQFNKEIAGRNITISECRDLIKKYEVQLMDVRNNREYEAINKEIELCNLEILTCERKIGIFKNQIEDRNRKLDEVQKKYDERNNDLKEKNNELSQLIEETRKEEELLILESQKAASVLEERHLKAYLRIRKNMRNGLAVVALDRNACGGCFAIIPPQRQYEIRQRKKIIVCENCGRILIDSAFFQMHEQGQEVPLNPVEA